MEPNGNESRLESAEQRWAEERLEFEAQDTERHRRAMAELEIQRVKIASLHASTVELRARSLRRDEQLRIDGERIRALLRIAELRAHRRSDLEDGGE